MDKPGKRGLSPHDFGISLAELYHTGIYYERNRALVDHSSELICYWDGGKGGTQYTMMYARRQMKPVIRINPV